MTTPAQTMTSHKYTPDRVIIKGRWQAVTSAESHPPGTHPTSPIKDEMTAMQLRTRAGSRWYGCERAYIDSYLRMVIVGYQGAESVNWERPHLEDR